MPWTVFYANGLTFSSDDGDPADAPREGVQVILTGSAENRRLLWKAECYCWEDEQWVEHDRFYADQYVSHTYHPIRLNGQTLAPERFKPILGRALAAKNAGG
jgi:hypothetical protein